MRILILTQPLRNNYGGLLQAYALQQVLKNMGHDVVTDRDGAVRDLSLWSRILRFVYHAIRFYILKDYRYYPYRYLFSSFNKEKKAQDIISINMRRFVDIYIDTIDFFTGNVKSLGDKVKLFDTIVVGSDQVWRASMSDIPTYFLSFTKGMYLKRVAYAASFGTDNLNEYSKAEIGLASEYIKLFNAVSVREETGIQLCRDYLKTDAVHVLDPTMLLDKNDYLKLIEDEDKLCSQDILLTYILDRTPEKSMIIEKISSLLHLSLCENGPAKNFSNIVEDNASECIYPSISKWLAGFRDAQFVVTDSFHGTVFSIIFNKPFVAILNPKRGSSRFVSLLRMLHLEDRLITSIGNVDEICRKEIDYKTVSVNLSLKKQDSMCYLINNL